MKINLEIKFVISLIFAILVALFAIQNAGSVEINFLFARFTISQALVILISAIVGAIVVLLISLVNQIHKNKEIKDLKKEVEILKEENKELSFKLDRLESLEDLDGNPGLIDLPMDFSLDNVEDEGNGGENLENINENEDPDKRMEEF